ncbi:hypothetical protein GM160_06635 [Guyparkeria halophila]|uniref:Serine protease n=1 Tax=Guyparkeria halophila TaxID=47960 RepID=A0A6I6D115_9GAMM|nr:hypothetical protein [Guyparkeria halophila]QGT78598.1 hypothetical protein GM160_06635 [Guyparkeria halophila]
MDGEKQKKRPDSDLNGAFSHESDPYDALVPIFVETKIPKRLTQIGTGVFSQIRGQPFLFTAAHVVDEQAQGTLLVPTSLGLVPIHGYMAHVDLPPEIPRRDDMIDVAYYRLSRMFAKSLCHHFRPLPPERTELIQSSLNLSVCSASGYPASKAKKDSEGVLSSEIFSFRGVAADQQTYDLLALSAEQSIIINFHKKRAIDPITMSEFPTPSLKGVSGGGIFAWPAGSELSDDWTLPRLVGIVHTFKQKEGLIIGSTLLPLMAAISLGKMKGFGMEKGVRTI